jgi:hypothetical protein
MKTLKTRHTTALPMREISALTARTSDSTGSQLLAVGDEDFAVITTDVSDNGTLGRTWRHDLLRPLAAAGIDVDSGSGFEGVASDGEGTVLLLQEEESRLLVLSPDISRLIQVLALEVPEDAAGYGRAWHADANARGEGLLLLERGHVLVAKQKEPVYLIEFGPADDLVRGIGPDAILGPGSTFQRPPGDAGRLVALAGWPLDDKTAEGLDSVNDIASGSDERAYFLSASARLIARLEKCLEPGEHAGATEFWEIDAALPGDEDARPEGLAFVREGTPIVGFDTKVAGDNVLVLSPLTG